MRLCLTSSPAIAKFTWQFSLSSAKILQYQQRGTDKSCAGPLPSLVLGLASAVQLTHTSFFHFLSQVPSPLPHHLPSPLTPMQTLSIHRHGCLWRPALLTQAPAACAVPYSANYRTKRIKLKSIELLSRTHQNWLERSKTAQRGKWDMILSYHIQLFHRAMCCLLQQQPSPLDTLSPSPTSSDTSHW